MRAGVPFPALALAAALSGCATLPPEMLTIAHNPDGRATRSFKDPCPKTLFRKPSGYFLIKACSKKTAEKISIEADRDYRRVMADTGLFHYRPRGLYPIIVYKDSQEYHRKTDAPAWSGGIIFGNAIYTYEGPSLTRTMAHEITHLIFHEHMGGKRILRWFNEGLAVYEEMQAGGPEDRRQIEEWLASSRKRPMRFSEMTSFTPGGPRTRLWYGQSASVARYLVEVGGRTNVERFLQASKSGRSLDQALAIGFPALCVSLADLEKHWLAFHQ